MTDGLTQVANHRHFQDRLREEFRRAQRYDDPLALILVDLDHFKNVNDNFGHQVGDEVLAAMAACVKAAVRETDFVARYGGEEFAVLLPKTHLAGALTVAERIAADMVGIKAGPNGLKVTASFGVSGFPGRSVNTSEQLVKTADEALYRAKREGRNKISLFQAPVLASVELIHPFSEWVSLTPDSSGWVTRDPVWPGSVPQDHLLDQEVARTHGLATHLLTLLTRGHGRQPQHRTCRPREAAPGGRRGEHPPLAPPGVAPGRLADRDGG